MASVSSRHIGALLLLAVIMAGVGLNIVWYIGAPKPKVATTSLQTQTTERTIATAFTSADSLDWLGIARVAWRYYQPGVGVNPETGINRAKLDWDALTDWNTGSYIVATIDAHKLGLIGSNCTWEFRDRMSRVFRHLLTRELGVNHGVWNWPYWAYYWNGRPYYNPAYMYTDVSDSGRLLYALDLLRRYDSSFQGQVREVFLRCKTAYDSLSTCVDERLNYYGVLEAVGFSAFGYDKSRMISAFVNWAGECVNVEGQMLPLTITTAEPTIHGVLDLNLDGSFFDLTAKVYEAQKARWIRTGRLSGWSEGCYPGHEYVYEWIITGDGKTWLICKHDGTDVNVEPLMYAKVAFAYLAMFGKNSYTSSLTNAAVKLQHAQYGFGEATFENGESAISLWGWNVKGFYSDQTNQIILAAARYAIEGRRAIR